MKFSKVAHDCFFNPERRHSKEFHAVAQRHKLLHTLNLNEYRGGYSDDTPFIMGLLDSFPALEKVVITPESSVGSIVLYSDDYFDYKFNKLELLDFPCASPKAKIIFSSYNP